MPTQSSQRQLILNTFFMRFGHHPAAWRHPSATGDGRPDVDYWVKLAVLAERAKFHTFFLADFIGRSADDLEMHSQMGVAFQFEPLTLLSHIAAKT
jgi:alkanesulfonate monooxygenase SsuD/methylene tetrahydromethanopterin reductase-like flavin-dependent oxidoreductase (luciferase family)